MNKEKLMEYQKQVLEERNAAHAALLRAEGALSLIAHMIAQEAADAEAAAEAAPKSQDQ